MAARKHHAGFTLIESLIASAILFALLAVAAGAMRFFSGYVEGGQRQQVQAFYQLRSAWVVHRAMQGVLPYLVRDRTGRPGLYFLGRREGFTAVTTQPLSSDQGLAVFRLFWEPDGQGKSLLVYEEALLTEPLRDKDQVLPFAYRTVVFTVDANTDFAFEYEVPGQARFDDPVADAIQPPEWVDELDAFVRLAQPSRIRLRGLGSELLLSLPDGGGAKLASAVTDI